jgi:hypothetical protein
MTAAPTAAATAPVPAALRVPSRPTTAVTSAVGGARRSRPHLRGPGQRRRTAAPPTAPAGHYLAVPPASWRHPPAAPLPSPASPPARARRRGLRRRRGAAPFSHNRGTTAHTCPAFIRTHRHFAYTGNALYARRCARGCLSHTRERQVLLLAGSHARVACVTRWVLVCALRRWCAHCAAAAALPLYPALPSRSRRAAPVTAAAAISAAPGGGRRCVEVGRRQTRRRRPAS